MQTNSILAPYFPQNLDDYAPWVAIHGLLAPYGKCQCGCGKVAPLAKVTRRKVGYAAGQPLPYVPYHHSSLKFLLPEPNPSGYCLCGCGQLAPIAKQSDSKSGNVAGKHTRFLYGHYKKSAAFKEQEFWARVQKGEPDECWIWTGNDNGKGYGTFAMESGRSGRAEYAHRIVYKMTYGPIPDGMEVCHKCDNPSCVNPNHLFVGTRQDNVDDMMAKGRHSSAKRHSRLYLDSRRGK